MELFVVRCKLALIIFNALEIVHVTKDCDAFISQEFNNDTFTVLMQSKSWNSCYFGQ